MKLSVLIMTYNHERFISQAIESALMQEADFDFEIVVGDDCSADNTFTIASDYERRHPGVVRVLRSECNLGGNRNFARILGECRGEYVAILDGDDYWTSREKLQKQVSFLDAHPECVICFHDVRTVWQDGSKPSSVLTLQFSKQISTIEDLLAPDHFMPNSSVVFKNHLVDQLPEWFYDMPVGDWPFHVLVARFGKMGYLKEVMGVYRRHPSSVLLTRKLEAYWHQEITLYGCLKRSLDRRFAPYIRTRTSRRYYALSVHWEQHGNMAKARLYALRRLTLRPLDRNPELALKHLLRLCIPAAVYNLAKRSLRIAKHIPFIFSIIS